MVKGLTAVIRWPIETKTILVVEDDLDDQEFISAALQSCGLRDAATIVEGGVQALDFLLDGKLQSRMPAVVILDLMLPKLSGLEVLQRLRADPRIAAVPVVLFSSSTCPDDINRSYQLGANSYVRKPVDPEDFTKAVVELARYWTARNIPAVTDP